MIDEDPFPPIASVKITANDLRVVLNEKKGEKFSPNVNKRKVWIRKQYIVYKDELVVKGKVSTTREKENTGRYPYHSKQEIKKEKPSKENNVFPKERHTFPEGKGRNTLRRKIPPRFVVPPSVPPKQKWHVVQHKKFPQKLNRSQKRRMRILRAMEKKKLLEEMPQENPKEVENLKEEMRPTSKRPNLEGRVQKMMSLLKRWMKKHI